MRRYLCAAVLAAGLTAYASERGNAVEHPATPGQDIASLTMQAFGSARPPFGYIEFCRRHPRDCDRHAEVEKKVELTPERWRELNEINRLINELVEPVTDKELYGVVEYWAYPVGQGDCEDYVLAKRRLLIQYGWPASALRITVVRDESNEGHAVLTVVTDRGDLILDNKTSDIAFWQDTPYVFQKRQSAYDPLVWETLNAKDELRQMIFDPVAAQ